MRRGMAVLWVLLCFVFAVAGCGSGGGTDPQASANEEIKAEDVQLVAKLIYDKVETGGITATDIQNAFNTFGIATISSTDSDALQAGIDANAPFLIDFQASNIAQRQNELFMVTVESFIKELAAKGATNYTDPSSNITMQYLSDGLASLVNKGSYSVEEVLPALVLALGRERASRSTDGITDQVWGDGMLDPIQFNLLQYSIYTSPLSSSSASIKPSSHLGTQFRKTDAPDAFSEGLTDALNALRKMVQKGLLSGDEATSTKAFNDGLRNVVTKIISKLIKFPLGYKDSLKASICASVKLYSYKVEVTKDPMTIYHRSDDGTPYESIVIANVNFDFVPNDNVVAQSVLAWSGCNIPSPGPQAGTKVAWELAGKLPEHGSLVSKDDATGLDGQAKATYRTINENTPLEERVHENKKTASGTVIARAQGLLPEWSNFEVVVRAMRPELGEGAGTLMVNYYEPDPVVISVSPADGAKDVPVNSVVAAIFSRDMDASTITNDTFTVSNTTGTVTYIAKEATFQPSELKPGTTYTASVTTGAKDTNGKALKRTYTWSFTTESECIPTISATPGKNQVTINWEAFTGAASYNLYWSNTSSVTKGSGNKISGVASPYEHTGLTNGTTYYYVMTCVDDKGVEGGESSEVAAMPVDYYSILYLNGTAYPMTLEDYWTNNMGADIDPCGGSIYYFDPYELDIYFALEGSTDPLNPNHSKNFEITVANNPGVGKYDLSSGQVFVGYDDESMPDTSFHAPGCTSTDGGICSEGYVQITERDDERDRLKGNFSFTITNIYYPRTEPASFSLSGSFDVDFSDPDDLDCSIDEPALAAKKALSKKRSKKSNIPRDLRKR